MQAPDCPAEQKVSGMRATTCLRFETPFQGQEGLDKRQAQLEEWGVAVTTDFATAVADCDAIMLEINDAAYHLEYMEKVAALGKPVFLDKPMADNTANGRAIAKLVAANNLRFCSGSSLRCVAEVAAARAAIPTPKSARVCGPLGKAPAGSSIVWYGVHAFEMLQAIMGPGAKTVQAVPTGKGFINVVVYDDGRHGIVDLIEGDYSYCGHVRGPESNLEYTVNMADAYSSQLRQVSAFFSGQDVPWTIDDTVEVLAMLDAAERSSQSGTAEAL